VGASPLTRVPWWTLGFLAIALIAQWMPGVAALLVYDRAAILHGEAWRVVSGHAVHFSMAHLLANAAVVMAAGWWVESRSRMDAAVLICGAALVIGIVLLVGEPGIHAFGGASGIALALAVFAGLRGFAEGGRMRAAGAAVVTLIGAKLVAEYGGWQVHDWRSAGFVTLASSHVIGAALGGLWYLRRAAQRVDATGPASAREMGAQCRHPEPSSE